MDLNRRDFLRVAAGGAVSSPWFSAPRLRASPASKPDGYDFSALIQPAPRSSRFTEPGYNVWCGTMARGEDGKYHLFYSRWRRSLGHQAWVTSSEIAHAVGRGPLGPFTPAGVALVPRGARFWDGMCTHNPTILKFEGRYFLYYMGNRGDGRVVPNRLNYTHRNNQRIGVAIADSPYGPWQRFDAPLISPTPGFHDALCCANPSVTPTFDGRFLMVYKGVGTQHPLPFGGPVVHIVATGDHPTGPFRKEPNPVFTRGTLNFVAEDPFVWRGPDRYWAIVKDNDGNFTGRGYSLALFESRDGSDWRVAPHALVSTPQIAWQHGPVQKLTALERPQLLLEKGEPVVLLCAAADRADRDGSFNVQIPLKRGL